MLFSTNSCGGGGGNSRSNNFGLALYQSPPRTIFSLLPSPPFLINYCPLCPKQHDVEYKTLSQYKGRLSTTQLSRSYDDGQAGDRTIRQMRRWLMHSPKTTPDAIIVGRHWASSKAGDEKEASRCDERNRFSKKQKDHERVKHTFRR